jgi:UDP-N-acetylglucosamine--N-acetylmuramyl-(pentapeptide) pyrophosphoryl-undecaprenol N-acetylglucosamine transferase
MKQQREYKFIISGGGTGGHVFPAIAIGSSLRGRFPGAEILFVGAENRLEMEKVPQAGFEIIGLPVSGFIRKITFKNFIVLARLLKSMVKASRIVKNFSPDLAIGVGGYASGPMIRAAAKKNIPVLLQEQNSHAGITNKILSKKADKICVAYEGMEKYFPAEKIVITGNPVRSDLLKINREKDEANRYFGLDPAIKTLLILGGSLGAKTINQSLVNHVDDLAKSRHQVIWQTGKLYYDQVKAAVNTRENKNIKVHYFLNRMDLAYAAADVIISRAGAGTISELCIVGKPVILIPSPNVAENHQEKNAMALVKKNAAIMITDKDALENLVHQSLKLIDDEKSCKELSSNITLLAKPDATDQIVDEAEKLIIKNNLADGH